MSCACQCLQRKQRQKEDIAKRKTGSTNKDLYLGEPRLTTRGVENNALLEDPSVNQTDSGRLDTKPTTLNQDQEKDDN